MSGPDGSRRLAGELLVECAEWVWEQLQEEGYFLAGELVELILQSERDLGVQWLPHAEIAARLEADFAARGVTGNPAPITADVVLQVLSWEDEFLALAGIPRAES